MKKDHNIYLTCRKLRRYRYNPHKHRFETRKVVLPLLPWVYTPPTPELIEELITRGVAYYDHH